MNVTLSADAQDRFPMSDVRYSPNFIAGQELRVTLLHPASNQKKKMFGLNVYFRSNLELECDDVSRDSVRLSQATGQHARCVNCAKAFGHVHLLVDLHLNAVCFSCLH